MKKIRIGLITYHGGYNFGSALQSFALQQTINRWGYECTIVNYRPTAQRYGYEMLRRKFGKKQFLISCTLLKEIKKWWIRKNRYEKFISEKLTLTDEVAEPKEALAQMAHFDVAMSGGDQLWNMTSREVRFGTPENIFPYVLKGIKNKKISYASSCGRWIEKNMDFIAPYLSEYEYLAMREEDSAEKLSQKLNRNVTTVLDPTLLLNKQEYMELLQAPHTEPKEPYMILYSLTLDYKEAQRMVQETERIATEKGLRLKVILPFVSVKLGKNSESSLDYGPIEFFYAVNSADLIITDSFHGSVFSIICGKEFYSITADKTDKRKTDLLNRLGLSDRVIGSIDEVPDSDDKKIDYDAVFSALNVLKANSLGYLKNALCVTNQ